MIRIAINGFGRIGRAAFKVALDKPDVEIVAINDLTDASTLAHLLRYDSVYGKFPGKIESTEEALVVNGQSYPVLSEKDPSKLPWQMMDVDAVLECTGIFTTQDKLKLHTDAGAKLVVLSAPAKDDTVPTFVRGVNDQDLKRENVHISNASCTTNCIAPVMAVLERAFGVAKASMTTIHAYTADQTLVDGPHKDLRRARAAALNIVPTTTGAAVAVGKTIPSLASVFDGMAIRVPVPVGSLSDITALLKRTVTIEEVNEALTAASKEELFKGILEVSSEPLVSTDIIGNAASSIVDLGLTNVVGGDLVKVVAWYDNEWGYANRLVEQAVEAATLIKGA